MAEPAPWANRPNILSEEPTGPRVTLAAGGKAGPAAVLVLFAATIFTGAGLLFVVQPMFARMVLPLLGGAPATWNTAMVFYQAALLAGYGYAHLTATRLGPRQQAVLHLLVLLLPWAILPIAVPAGWLPPTGGNPVPWLLGLMLAAVGLPFFAVSTTSPLLQRWFSGAAHERAADPYFLYAASNAGSMIALLSYPLWIEPHFSLGQQGRIWSYGYGLLAVLTAGCAVVRWRFAATAERAATPVSAATVLPGWRRQLRWVLLAFVPSSLLLGVTTYVSSEVAAVPLFWVIPLAVYLLTFILAFARRQLVPRRVLVRLWPMLLVPLVMALDMQASQPLGWLLLLHLMVFFIAAMLCHGALAADRPAPEHLTAFYFWISVGGVLGGVLNALVAPLVFNSVAEYPLMLVLACAVGLGGWAGRWRLGDWLAPLLVGLAALGLVWGVQATRFKADAQVAGLVFGVPALGAYFLSREPRRFTLAVAGLLLAGTCYQGEKGRVIRAERTFFGVHRVTTDATGEFRLLVHGTTLHGIQNRTPGHDREPLAYYHRTGPIGAVLAAYGRESREQIGVVGLGAGSLAAYALPGQAWTYFEIDPVVLQLARDDRYFTYLRDAAVPVRVALGDARLSLAREPAGRFSVLVVDAYSSDAIPVHLLTREALALYVAKLAPGGVLAFHISNQHLDLEPVFANLARDAGLVALTGTDTAVSTAELATGKSPSVWLVMARRPADLAKLAPDARWQPSRDDPAQAVWTDGYSSVLSVFRWR